LYSVIIQHSNGYESLHQHNDWQNKDKNSIFGSSKCRKIEHNRKIHPQSLLRFLQCMLTFTFSQQSVSIFSPKISPITLKTIVYNYGILRDKKDLDRLFPAIWKMLIAHLLYLMWLQKHQCHKFSCGQRCSMKIKEDRDSYF